MARSPYNMARFTALSAALVIDIMIYMHNKFICFFFIMPLFHMKINVLHVVFFSFEHSKAHIVLIISSKSSFFLIQQTAKALHTSVASWAASVRHLGISVYPLSHVLYWIVASVV